MGKTTRRYTDEFKQQIVELKKAGRSTTDLMREYDLTKTSINTWARQFANSGSFKSADNMTETEKPRRQHLKKIVSLKWRMTF